jgi:hypothetical protein
MENKGANVASLLRSLNGTWLGIISDLLKPNAPRRDIREVFDTIYFITFNYDRCIEQYLFHKFTSAFANSPIESLAHVNAVNVHHVYGSLGEFKKQNSMRFGVSDESLGRALDEIRTYNEEIHSRSLHDIRTLIYSADRIIFLGCAYHTQNLKMLFGDVAQFSGRGVQTQIWGTTLGIRPAALTVLNSYFDSLGALATLDPIPANELLTKWQDHIFA